VRIQGICPENAELSRTDSRLPGLISPAISNSMKTFASFVTLLGLLAATAPAQEVNTNSPSTNSVAASPPAAIAAAEAKKHLNTQATVTGTIAEVHLGGSVVHLNFEKPFPDAPFIAVIFANKTNLFPEIEKLKGKTVEVSGMITEYRSKPEIILTSTNQLKIVEKVATPAATEKK
jgi:hypothetical protein